MGYFLGVAGLTASGWHGPASGRQSEPRPSGSGVAQLTACVWRRSARTEVRGTQKEEADPRWIRLLKKHHN